MPPLILLWLLHSSLAMCIQVREISSPSDVIGSDAGYETDFWRKVNFPPVPAYYIDTHDPVSQDRYISASVHQGKIWDYYIWDRIVSLTPPDASGLVFVDVGANIGYFSLAAASLGYNVVSFEPMSRNAKKLAKSIKMNDFGSRVTLYQNAVAEASGQRVLLRETDVTNQGNGQVVQTDTGSDNDMAYATTVTLSEVLSGIDAFIVILDVEGHEVNALQGGKDWICRNTVRHVIMEVSNATKESGNLLELMKFMRSVGYSVFDVAVGSVELDLDSDSFDVGGLPPNIIFTLTPPLPICNPN